MCVSKKILIISKDTNKRKKCLILFLCSNEATDAEELIKILNAAAITTRTSTNTAFSPNFLSLRNLPPFSFQLN